MPKKKTAATKQKKLPRIKPINNFALLMVLSVFQLLSGTAAAGGTGSTYRSTPVKNCKIVSIGSTSFLSAFQKANYTSYY